MTITTAGNTVTSSGRTIGLLGAVSVGVGAIVGGGILALAGVAFASTGPSAIVAFGLNGVIALLTALSFAELSAVFPQSGGTYTFAKKVLSVRAAFMVGWVVWFASIVAAVLYAIGFGAFAVIIIEQVWQTDFGSPPVWLHSPWAVTGLAIGATLVYMASMMRESGGGGPWANIGKVFVFGVLIVGGLWALTAYSPREITVRMTPFFATGFGGLIQAMGYTFIALQGFDLIAAVAGEVKEPQRVIPRAMLISLGIALLIYLPLLFVITTVGVPDGANIVALSAAQPETIIAIAAQNYLGQFGYWLVMVAAVLSMLSALQANLFAASRVALTMSRDRTLPRRLEQIDPTYGTPRPAILATTAIIIALLIILPDVASAGAASSLIFLITFALAHGISILARRRRGENQPALPFQVPAFPAVPLIGAAACIGLAVFQGSSVPSAGLIATMWLIIGTVLYLSLFGRRARVVDAAAEAMDPQLMQLRGRSPLVLVPIANPDNADEMVYVADSLSPPNIGRVLLLTVVTPPSEDWQPSEEPQRIIDAQAILRGSLTASFEAKFKPEALTTIANDPWREIARVAQVHRCESLLLGLTNFSQGHTGDNLERLMTQVSCDVVVLRAKENWRPKNVKRILIPVGGQGNHSALRARLLSNFSREGDGEREFTFLQIMPANTPDKERIKAERRLLTFAKDEVPREPQVKVLCTDEVRASITQEAAEADLVILGLRQDRQHRGFGDITLHIAKNTDTPIIMISHHN